MVRLNCVLRLCRMETIFDGTLEWDEKNHQTSKCVGILKECPKCKRRVVTFKNGISNELAKQED